MGESDNLIILAPGEGQEVIIRWEFFFFFCGDSDGNVDHKLWDAGPQVWRGWR